MSSKSSYRLLLSSTILVATLGYFVDIYDLLLFTIVRVDSLKAMGLDDASITAVGADIYNWQQAGLILGGLFWGVLADKKGRLSVLFGSILTYSLANLACGFVETVYWYKLFRFIAGIGLAGELGVGITLVAESLPKDLRGYGSSLVSGVGLLGAVFAYFVLDFFKDWRLCYFIGGGLGLALLLLRVSVLESELFHKTTDEKKLKKGSLIDLFTQRSLLSRFLLCIGIALPIWYFVGVLCAFSKEIGEAFGIAGVQPSKSILYCYIGLAIGDVLSGLLSQWLQSRKKTVGILMLLTLGVSILMLTYQGTSSDFFYYTAGLGGLTIGYWAMFMTITAEQFGTNIRATATTSAPNMVRGALIPMLLAFKWLKPQIGTIEAAAWVGGVVFLVSFFALYWMKESFYNDLDFIES